VTDLDWRPLTTADLPELAALIAAIRRHNGEPAVVTAQSLGQTFAELDWDPALDSLLAVDGTIAGYAGTARPRAGGQRVPTLGGVHPQWRGRGIGRRLLGWQLDRAHTQWVAAGAVEPWNFRTGGVDADGTAARLYARFGLVAVRHWLLMQRPVADPIPLVAAAEGLEIVPFEDRYGDAVYATHMAAFADHWGFEPHPITDYRHRFQSAAFRPRLSMLALTEAGAVAAFLLSTGSADPTRMTIGTIATRREWRRRGVATALIARTLAAYRAAGVRTANLGVDAENGSGAVGIYERMGFRAAQEASTFSRSIGD